MRRYDHVIYHGGCTDGFTAAWLLHHHLPGAEVHAGRYGVAPPAELAGHVVIADFSYPRDELLELAGRVDRVTILDHHATAVEHLTDLPNNVDARFDLDHSGAVLTFDWLLEGDAADEEGSAPAGAELLATYVEDRDLWRFALPDSQAVAARILATPLEYEAWDALAAELHYSPERAIAAGQAVIARDEVLIAQILGTVRHVELERPGEPGSTWRVPVVASPYGLGSSVAGRLAAANPEGIGAYYIDYEDRREYGLRSTDEGPDVARLAEHYGGGGHVHASGFRIARGSGRSTEVPLLA